MKILFTLLASFVILTQAVFSQKLKDTIEVKYQRTKLIGNVNAMLEDLVYYLVLQKISKSILLNSDPNTQWMWTSFTISNSVKEASQIESNFEYMASPLYQKYLEDSTFNPFRYALGLAQTGAVGYLAYKHIKKYRLLKK